MSKDAQGRMIEFMDADLGEDIDTKHSTICCVLLEWGSNFMEIKLATYYNFVYN